MQTPDIIVCGVMFYFQTSVLLLLFFYFTNTNKPKLQYHMKEQLWKPVIFWSYMIMLSHPHSLYEQMNSRNIKTGIQKNPFPVSSFLVIGRWWTLKYDLKVTKKQYLLIKNPLVSDKFWWFIAHATTKRIIQHSQSFVFSENCCFRACLLL